MWFVEFFRRCFGYRFPRLGAAANNLFVKIAPRFIETDLFPGIAMRLDMRDLTQRATYWQGSRFEYPTAHILADWGNQGAAAFFDIGSNYGFFSYWMLSNFPQLVVYSFEPNPLTFKFVESVKTANRLGNLHPQAMGLSDARESLPLHLAVTDSGHSTFGDHPGLRGAEIAHIPLAPFDQWCAEQGIAIPASPQWVAKIDVEGFELRVLKGMAASLRARAFIGLVVEINPFTLEFTGASADQILAFMTAHGYKLMHSLDAFGKGNANAFFIPA